MRGPHPSLRHHLDVERHRFSAGKHDSRMIRFVSFVMRRDAIKTEQVL